MKLPKTKQRKIEKKMEQTMADWLLAFQTANEYEPTELLTAESAFVEAHRFRSWLSEQ